MRSEPALGQPPRPVLRAGGLVPRFRIEIQPDKPAEHQVPGQLAHQGAFRRDAQQLSARERQEHSLWGNRWAAHLGTERLSQLPNPCRVNPRSDLPHGMIRGHSFFHPYVLRFMCHNVTASIRSGFGTAIRPPSASRPAFHLHTCNQNPR